MDPYSTADGHAAARPPHQPPPLPPLPPFNPYAAPAARLPAARHADCAKASRAARLGAVLLDGVIVGGAAILIAILVPTLGGAAGGGPSAAGTVLLALFGLFAIGYLAAQLILLYRHGQTVGKRLVGIKIVRTDGSRAGLRRIVLLRSLVPGLIGVIPLLGPLFSLADPLFIFGDEKRCLHDHLADTIVVDA